MNREFCQISLQRWLWFSVLGCGVVILLSACASIPQVTQTAAPSATFPFQPTSTPLPASPTPHSSATPAITATSRPLPSLTLTLTPEPTWTPFPKSLEAYGMAYDANATPNIPPRYSVSWWIWGNAIPATPIESTPQLISYPPPDITTDSEALLLEAGCQESSGYDVQCAQDSPLKAFNCFFITDPKEIYFKPTEGFSLVAGCDIWTEDWENPPTGTIYISGCAFKFSQGYIFKTEGNYVLIDTIEKLNDLFLPIDSSTKALSYALMRTGLHAYFDFSYDPTLFYLQDSIEGTHISEDAGGFVMNLYHPEGCGCEPWITSKVDIRVERSGKITWIDALPAYMTTGYSCVD